MHTVDRLWTELCTLTSCTHTLCMHQSCNYYYIIAQTPALTPLINTSVWQRFALWASSGTATTSTALLCMLW